MVCGVVPNEAQPLFAFTQGSATCGQFGIGAAKHIDFLRLGCTRTVGLLLLKLA
jgi:hypothetical protein